MFHVLNRGVQRMALFEKEGDYAAFERIIGESLDLQPMRICAYCLMPNHWHFVLWPRRDGDLAAFMQQLTNTHVQRWQQHRHCVGYGHVYQGRYKSFPVQTDEHFYQVVRYVERNALRANLVQRAEDWRWGSLWRRCHGDATQRAILSAWPVEMPPDWLQLVNRPRTEAELEVLRRCAQRRQPFGDADWIKRTARDLGLESTLRPRGRPRKQWTQA